LILDILELDYEGYQDDPVNCDLLVNGLDRYCNPETARPLMAAYRFNRGRMNHWEAHKGPVPAELREALMDSRVQKRAFNAQFERVYSNRVLGIPSPIKNWRCTMVRAYMSSFYGGLDKVGLQMGLPSEKQKSSRGKQLIQIFCGPQKVSKNQPHRIRDHRTDPELWQEFIDYNIQDVISESHIWHTLEKYTQVLPFEWEMYEIDQAINDRGFPVDMVFVENAIEMSNRRKEEITDQMREITGLSNPGSVQQLKSWLNARGYEYNDMQKESIQKSLTIHEDRLAKGLDSHLTPEAAAVMYKRQWQARMATKKYDALRRCVGAGDRVRYMFQFAGAGRTNRWAGRIVQTQNLARPPKSLDEDEWLEYATKLIQCGDYEMLSFVMEGEPMEALVGCVRSAFRAPEGFEFTVADLSSIETAVIAWMSDCKRLLKVFADKKDAYKDFAVVLFAVLYDEVTKRMRQMCKPAQLGCGYRLGGGNLYDGKRTGLWGYAEGMGVEMTQDEAKRAVDLWRKTYPEIPTMWKDQEAAAARCMRTGLPQQIGLLTFERKPPYLLMRLPSGRAIHYFQPQMVEREIKTGKMIEKVATNDSDYFMYGARPGETYMIEETYKKVSLTHMGKNQMTTQWQRIDSHGGRTTEQGTQAIARDIFAVGMYKAAKYGFKIVGHSHDELVTLTRKGDSRFTLEALVGCMVEGAREIAPWMYGCPLGADGFQSDFYKK
jgi:DNA polymerase